MTHAVSSWTTELRATLALGWPIALTNLAQVAINTTDTLMLGWLGPQDLAAGALAMNLYWAVLVLGIGVTMATAPLLAQTLGRNRHSVRACRRIVRQGLWLAITISLPAWLLMWNAEEVLLAFGQDADLAARAAVYARAMQWGLLPALGFTVLRSFIAAQERPKAGLVVTMVAIAFNAALGWSLIFGHAGMPALGLAGAGIAASASNTVMFLALMAVLMADRRFRRYHLLGRFWHPDIPMLRELLRVGVPMGLSMGFEITGINAAAFLCGMIGTTAVAAHTIAMQIASVTFMVPMGLAHAATVRVGLAAGMGNADGIRKAGWVALGLGVLFMTAMAMMLITIPASLVGLFMDLSRPEAQAVANVAVGLLAVAGLFQIADGTQVVGAGVLRGLKDTRIPMVFTGLGYWGLAVPLGAALAFSAHLGALGIWIGLACGLAVVASLVAIRWTWRRRLGLLPPEGEA